MIRRAAPWLLAGVVLVLVGRQAAGIDWREVGAALRELPAAALLAAAAAGLAGHAVFACYDLVGRRVVAHRATRARTWGIAAVSYALNLNLGALVGGVAVRLRLYARAGVPAAQAGQVVAVAMAGNWLGWAGLAAAALCLADP
ncbi:MAG: UPF0104 family protein, partial [Rubrivivax sp.]|nr:UPF0104 family protein [Rubrivivax sp.]